jgi:2-polyprenyl-3-methyl-5-hydroxy-6-metoxy-1,4-benzoquinol methylase
MVGKDVNESLMQSAAIQAGVPVICKKIGADELGKLGPAVADAVVFLGGMQHVQNLQAFTNSVIKVLKPSGRCVHKDYVCVPGS